MLMKYISHISELSGYRMSINRRLGDVASVRKEMTARGYLQLLLLSAWILSLVALPIAKYIWGDTALNWGVMLSVVLQTALVVTILLSTWNGGRVLRTVAIIAVLAWTIEFIGSSTGIPFGVYYYTDKLQPQIGHVPLLIPFAWLMMLPPAWAVARKVVGTYGGVKFVLVSALALTAWDLFLDPQMVAWGYWVWENPGVYFGIPLLNFFGWILTGAIMTAVIRPNNLPLFPLIFIYGLTWILETIGQLFFWGLPGPALFGFVGMGYFLWLIWSTQQKQANGNTAGISPDWTLQELSKDS
jgi:putative membrane protein